MIIECLEGLLVEVYYFGKKKHVLLIVQLWKYKIIKNNFNKKETNFFLLLNNKKFYSLDSIRK